MRGVTQATVGRLPSPALSRRSPSWLTGLTRERRWPSERLETIERLQRERRQALRAGVERPELKWLRGF